MDYILIPAVIIISGIIYLYNDYEKRKQEITEESRTNLNEKELQLQILKELTRVNNQLSIIKIIVIIFVFIIILKGIFS